MAARYAGVDWFCWSAHCAFVSFEIETKKTDNATEKRRAFLCFFFLFSFFLDGG